MTRSEAAVARRLAEQTAEIEETERRLAAMKKRRDCLIVKLACSQVPEREIAKVAGVTGVRVGQIKRATLGSDPRFSGGSAS